MTNSNCLENIKCPACGYEYEFRIAAKTIATVTDNGIDDYGDLEWDADSYAECADCQHRGTLKDFTVAAPQPYFCGPSGTRYLYSDIADRIRKEAPHTLGEHIYVQLEAIGLLDEMINGTTPYGLPFTFAEKSPLIEKQLTSTGLIHTPGLFRAFQNDYRIKGKTRPPRRQDIQRWIRLSRERSRGAAERCHRRRRR